MLTLDQTVYPHPEVVDTELDIGKTVLLHLESRNYYSLNSTGVRIWNMLKQGLSLKEVSNGLQQEFGIDEERAARCVLELTEDLFKQKLVLK